MGSGQQEYRRSNASRTHPVSVPLSSKIWYGTVSLRPYKAHMVLSSQAWFLAIQRGEIALFWEHRGHILKMQGDLNHLSPEFLNNTIGALEAGGMIACLLMGIVTTQVYYYYSKFPKDHVGLKILVAFVWICELGHSICISHSIYAMTIVSWSNPRVFDSPPKTLLTAVLFSSLSIPLIQSFFGWRIKGLAGGWTLTLICWTMSLTRTTMLLIAFVGGVRLISLQQYVEDWEWSILTSPVIGTANDVLMALSLIWILIQRRGGATVSRSTVAVIDTLVLWTLETGLLTRYVSTTTGILESSKSALCYDSIGGVLMMIMFLTMPHNFIWLAVYTFLAKLYSNSLMASLNGRDTLRQKAGNVVELYPASIQYGVSTFRVRDTPRNTDHTSQIAYSDDRLFEVSKHAASDPGDDANDGTAGHVVIVIEREVVMD
ncbi:hypothetical protein PM082_016174 [Marasmius tenuissimus]|nr:hypothetical protein PM082_016174 [Marasmius tenuissimus]